MADSKKYDGSQWKHSLRKLTTATEAVENPLYSDGTAITSYTIKGNTVQNGTPTPSNPVDVNGVGVRTENLFDASIYTKSNVYKSGCTVSVTGGNLTITATGSDPYVGELYSTGALVNPVTRDALIEVLPNTTYTINTRQNKCYVTICDASFYSVFAQKMPVTSKYTSFSFTTPNNAKYALFRFGNGNLSVGQSYTFDNIMLTKGSALPYEPYGYKIPISNGQQTTNIYLGSTQTTRRIKKLVLTGEENFGRQNISDADPTFARFSKIFQFGSVTSTGTILYASTHFTGLKSFNTTSSTAKNCFEMRFASGTTTMMIVTNVATTATSFNQWLAAQYANGTPVTVWYVLTTPETAAVNEPLMKIGDYADTVSNTTEIPTTEGANSITVDTTVQPSEFTATWTGWHNANVKEWDSSWWNE